VSHQRIAVVGFGAAGFHGVKALRENGCQDPVDVYFREVTPLANPMLTTYYLEGKISYAQMFPFGTAKEISDRYGLTIYPGVAATGLLKDKTLRLSNGSQRQYDHILIAAGAEPVVPAFCEGSSRIFTMRSPDDAVKAEGFLQQRKPGHCIVVGASMAGIKVVEALEGLGVRCLLADAATRVFPLASTPRIAEEIEKRLEQKGLEIILGASLNAVRESDGMLEVELGETTVKTDMLVLCIGTRPEVGWCRDALDTDRGILVADTMETSLSGVYAAGDCAQGREIQSGKQTVLGLWPNARRQGEVAGANIAGQNRKHSGELLHNITHFMEMEFAGIGDPALEGESVYYRARDGSWEMEAILRDGVLSACNILGNSPVGGMLKASLARQGNCETKGLDSLRKGLLCKRGLDRALLTRLGGDRI